MYVHVNACECVVPLTNVLSYFQMLANFARHAQWQEVTVTPMLTSIHVLLSNVKLEKLNVMLCYVNTQYSFGDLIITERFTCNHLLMINFILSINPIKKIQMFVQN